MTDCLHKRALFFSNVKITGGDLVLFFSCPDCGSSGFLQVDVNGITCPESDDNDECSEMRGGLNHDIED